MKHPTFCSGRARVLAAVVWIASLWLTGTAATAQTPGSPAQTRPMRNLQIEVRQVQSDAREGASAGVQGGVQIGSNGQVGLSGQVQIQQRSQLQSGTSNQFALVLNGRSTRIALGATVPVRVYQTLVRNGQRVLSQGAVLLEARTGFNATPRWDGSDAVELEITAQQTLGSAPQACGLNPNASVSSVLVLPLGEWSTIARSEESGSASEQGLAGGASGTRQTAVEVQVRVTVR